MGIVGVGVADEGDGQLGFHGIAGAGGEEHRHREQDDIFGDHGRGNKEATHGAVTRCFLIERIVAPLKLTDERHVEVIRAFGDGWHANIIIVSPADLPGWIKRHQQTKQEDRFGNVK
jgi:hypothetical protein